MVVVRGGFGSHTGNICAYVFIVKSSTDHVNVNRFKCRSHHHPHLQTAYPGSGRGTAALAVNVERLSSISKFRQYN